MRLGKLVRPWQPLSGNALIGLRDEAAAPPGAQLSRDGIALPAAAVHLQRHIKLRAAHAGVKPRQFVFSGSLLGKRFHPRKLDQLVHVGAKAADELPCVRQADQRNMRIRKRLAQRTQRGHCAEHVTQLQRPEDRDARGCGRRCKQRGDHAALLPKRSRPTVRQKMDKSGMPTDVIARSITLRAVRLVPRSRRMKKCAVNAAQTPAASIAAVE